MDDRDNIRDRIWSYLRDKGKQTTTQIANDIGEIRDSVDKTLKRMEKKNEVSKQGQYWGLRNR